MQETRFDHLRRYKANPVKGDHGWPSTKGGYFLSAAGIFSTNRSKGGSVNLIKTMVIAISIGAAGCAAPNRNYTITYDSEPRGASVICGGNNAGYAPVTLNYVTSPESRRTGVLRPTPCEAKWSSGASARYNSSISMSQFPNAVKLTAARPMVDGYAQDAEFALKVEGLRAQQSQAAAAQRSAAAAEERNRKVKTCTTSFGVTTCY